MFYRSSLIVKCSAVSLKGLWSHPGDIGLRRVPENSPEGLRTIWRRGELAWARYLCASCRRSDQTKARSTLHSLPFPPSKLAASLIAFVVHISNLVPKINSFCQFPAYTAFHERVLDYNIDAPFPFGKAGFLKKMLTAQSLSATPRSDYCRWLSTTRNVKGTHRCLNVSYQWTLFVSQLSPPMPSIASSNSLSTQIIKQLSHQNPRLKIPTPHTLSIRLEG